MASKGSVMKHIVLFVTLAGLLIGGEWPVIAYVTFMLRWLSDMPQLTAIGIVYVSAMILVTLIGRLLGQAAIRNFRRGKQERETKRMNQGVQILQYGRGFAFVLASFVGGSALIAWWYVREGDPAVGKKAWLGALILGVTSPAFCIAMNLPQYRVPGIVVLVGVLVASVVYPLVARQRQTAESVQA